MDGERERERERERESMHLQMDKQGHEVLIHITNYNYNKGLLELSTLNYPNSRLACDAQPIVQITVNSNKLVGWSNSNKLVGWSIVTNYIQCSPHLSPLICTVA
jgi:hypothetical protein